MTTMKKEMKKEKMPTERAALKATATVTASTTVKQEKNPLALVELKTDEL